LPLSIYSEDITLQNENSEKMKLFFSQIKSNGDYIRFVLLTGVSRVAFSTGAFGFNNLTEITYDKGNSTICGITMQEIENKFFNQYNYILDNLRSFPKY
jgi:hypothetical protein